MDIEKNMLGAIRRLEEVCELPPKEVLKHIEHTRRGLYEYLLNWEETGRADLHSLANHLGVDADLLQARGLIEDEAAFYIILIDTLLFLASVIPMKRKSFIRVLIHCIYLFKNNQIFSDDARENNSFVSLSYRHKLRITAVRAYQRHYGLDAFPICPRCKRTMEREYQSYCDRCGQALFWKGFKKAKVIFGSNSGTQVSESRSIDEEKKNGTPSRENVFNPEIDDDVLIPCYAQK